MKIENRIFIILTSTFALGQMMADIYLPSFLAIEQGLNTRIEHVQYSLSIYMFGFGVSQLIYGPLSDAYGRRKFILIGLSLCVFGSVLCWASPNVQVLWLGRVCQGIGAGATLTLCSAVMRDLFEGNTLAKYGSYSAVVMAIVLMMAPLLGGYIQETMGWRTTFAVLLIYSLGSLIAFVLLVPETNRYLHPENIQWTYIKKNVGTLVVSPIFIGYTTCSLLTYGAILAWLTSGPVVLQKVVGLSPVKFGWVYAVAGLSFALGAFLNGKLVDKVGINRMLQIGLFGMLIAGITMLSFKLVGLINPYVIAGPAAMLLFSASLVFPNTSAGLFQPFPHIAGLVSALFYSSRLLGGAIFSAIITLMPNTTQMPMAIAFIFSAALAWGILTLSITSKSAVKP